MWVDSLVQIVMYFVVFLNVAPFLFALSQIVSVIYLYDNHFLERPNPKRSRWLFSLFAFVAISLALAIDLTYGYSLIQSILYLLLASLSFPYMFLTAKGAVAHKKNAVFASFLLPCFCSFFLVEAWDYTNVLSYQCTTFPTYSFLALAVALSAIILSKMRDLRKEKEQADRLLIQYQSIKQESLKERIKPHFIFNYLIAIENNYHKDLASGDEAMEQFAQHLRSNVDSMGRDLIPFEDELKNILNYVDLEAITEKRIVFFGFEEDHPVVASVRIRVE